MDICKRRIIYLNLPSVPSDFSDSDRLLFMSSLVPFDNVCMVIESLYNVNIEPLVICSVD